MADLRKIPLLLLAALTASLGATSAQTSEADAQRRHGAHVHGAWRMFAALDGAQLSIVLSGPLIDVLGFETLPQSEEERAAVAALTERLTAPEFLVRPDRRAKCELAGPAAIALPDGFSATNETRARHNGHVEHEAHENHDEHGEHDEGGNDVEASFAFVCSAPSRLDRITVTAFNHFEGVQTVEAVFLSGDGQSARLLTPQVASLKVR